jgi:hypothetical protein
MTDQNLNENEVPEAEAETVEAQPVEEPVAAQAAEPVAEEAGEVEAEAEIVDTELMATSPTNDPLAIVSLVCGILSWVFGLCCGFFGLPLAIAAVITGIIAMNRIKANPDTYTGHGVALAGTIVGGVGIVLTIVGVVFGIGAALITEASN